MKFFVSLLMLAFSLPTFSLAFFSEGGHDGGGGKGLVCYTDQTFEEIKSVELFDFFEGRMLEGLIIPSLHGDFKAIYSQIIRKSSSKKVKELMDEGSKISKGFKFLPKGVRLKPIDDSNEIFIPKECRIEQLANFQGMSRIFIVSDFWDRMSEVDRAGLLMHEFLWTTERLSGATSSARARRTVARFFAENYNFSQMNFNPELGDIICSSGNSRNRLNTMSVGIQFLVKKRENSNECEITFNYVSGLPVMNQTTTVWEDCRENDILVGGASPTNPPSDMQVYLGFEYALPLYSDDIWSHTMTWKKDFKGEVPKMYMTVKVSNMEFPGFDDPEETLTCDQIDENDLKEPWWK